jgi:hypothetical protein
MTEATPVRRERWGSPEQAKEFLQSIEEILIAEGFSVTWSHDTIPRVEGNEPVLVVNDTYRLRKNYMKRGWVSARLSGEIDPDLEQRLNQALSGSIYFIHAESRNTSE